MANKSAKDVLEAIANRSNAFSVDLRFAAKGLDILAPGFPKVQRKQLTAIVASRELEPFWTTLAKTASPEGTFAFLFAVARNLLNFEHLNTPAETLRARKLIKAFRDDTQWYLDRVKRFTKLSDADPLNPFTAPEDEVYSILATIVGVGGGPGGLDIVRTTMPLFVSMADLRLKHLGRGNDFSPWGHGSSTRKMFQLTPAIYLAKDTIQFLKLCGFKDDTGLYEDVEIIVNTAFPDAPTTSENLRRKHSAPDRVADAGVFLSEILHAMVLANASKGRIRDFATFLQRHAPAVNFLAGPFAN